MYGLCEEAGYSSKAKVSPEKFNEMKAQFLFDVKTIVVMEDIPADLIINWDHTGLNYVPVSNWTMAAQGSKRVEIGGIDDKRQITAVFAGTMSGLFLPPQIIYQGNTTKCLPPFKFPNSWHITYSHNHWANERTTEDYIRKFLCHMFRARKRSFVHHQQSSYLTDSKGNVPLTLCLFLRVITSTLLQYRGG